MQRFYQIGEVLNNRFEILNLFKSTELSRTYLALDRTSGNKVIIKCASSDSGDGNGKVKLERLRAEASILQLLNHPSIVRFVDSWGNSSNYNLVIEYVDARSMKEIFANGSLTREQIIEYITQVLEIADYLHQKNIVHRDIKPANLLMNDTVVMLDFGATELLTANSSLADVVIGTPGYQCPESFRGFVSIQSDIYSIGATLLFLLTKQTPSGDLNRFRNLTEHTDLLQVAFQAMDPNIQKRFKTTLEMKRRLVNASGLGPRLVHKEGIYPILKSCVTMGRGEGSDFRILDQLKFVSPIHAELCENGKEYFLIDKSINGTFLYRNETYTRIDKCCLLDGDTIALCYKPSKGAYKIVKFRIGNH